MDNQRLTEELRTATEALRMALHMQSNEQVALTLFRANDLQRARDVYADALNAATMEAYAEGALTGKNQAERDVQLTSYLAGLHCVQNSTDGLRRAERTLANLEANLERAQASYKAALYAFHAAKAIAELRTAELQTMACQAPALEPTNGYGF